MADLNNELYRGEKAKAILESEIFKDTIAKIQQKAFDDFAECDPSDVDKLRECRLMLSANANFVRQLIVVMNTGKLAAVQLEQGKQK